MRHILIFGDSNTWGFEGPSYDPVTDNVRRFDFETRWPGRVQMLLGDFARVHEDGYNGRTCVSDDPFAPYRRGLDTLRLLLDVHAPLDLVMLGLGANDVKERFQLSPEMIALGMRALIDEARAPRYGYKAPQVAIIAPPPLLPSALNGFFGFEFGRSGYEKSLRLPALYRQLARERQCALIDCSELDFELNPDDGLHYSPRDHEKLARAAAEVIRERLG